MRDNTGDFSLVDSRNLGLNLEKGTKAIFAVSRRDLY